MDCNTSNEIFSTRNNCFNNHPFNNHLILWNLFGVCSSQQLAELRLVCKEFYDESLKIWRSSFTTKFKASSVYFNQELLSDLSAFLDYCKNLTNRCDQKPYKRFEFKCWSLMLENDIISDFVVTCGPRIQYLELVGVDFRNEETFCKIVFSAFPQLETLILKDSRGSEWSGVPVEEGRWYDMPADRQHKSLKHLDIDLGLFQEPLPVSWINLLSHLPKLVYIRLHNADSTESVKMLNAVQCVRAHNNNNLCLKSLDMLLHDRFAQESIPAALAEIICNLKLPLESLKMDFSAAFNEAITSTILHTHRYTLKSLDAYRVPFSMPYERFPFGFNLNNLQKISLSEKITSNLHFLKYTPNLRSLNIFDEAESDTGPFFECDIISNTLQSEMESINMTLLSNFRMDYECSVQDICNLILWLPNIQKLRMPLNDDQFSNVCGQWKNLEVIEVLGIQLTDAGILGNYMDNEQQLPNIKNLPKLRSFIMNEYWYHPAILLNDSAFSGFLQCPCLTILKIGTKMDDEACNALLKKVPNCILQRYPNYTEEMEQDEWGLIN